MSSYCADDVEWDMARACMIGDNSEREGDRSERRHVCRVYMISSWYALRYKQSQKIQAVT